MAAVEQAQVVTRPAGPDRAAGPPHPTRDHCLAPSRRDEAEFAYTGRYDRLFPGLAPLDADDRALLCLGEVGGACDGGASSADASGPAGWPFFGQFIAHDITADRSPLVSHGFPETIRNFGTPRASLGCLYGSGPVGSPFLYQRDDPAKLLIGVNDLGERADVPRNREGIALIGDPRNDVHLLISQLHLALMKVHNGFVDRLRIGGSHERDVFDEAARATRWHYQWIIANEYLPAAAGAEMVGDVLSRGARLYLRDCTPYIPFEFADGAFRYGHGQIRETYRVNESSGQLSIFPDLVGFRPVPARRTVDWSLMFDTPGEVDAQRARRLDGKLARALIRLPRQTTGGVDAEAYRSLAARDLERGSAVGLPSGESVARAAGERPLAAAELGLRSAGWPTQTPLWLYFMLEAAARGGGDRLGPVGGRIVTEVLLGILDADPGSYRSVEPGWRPTLPSRGRFGIADLLEFAAAAG